MVHADGRVEVVIPSRNAPSERTIAAFIERHRVWLERQQAKRRQQPARIPLVHPTIPMQLVKRQSHVLVETYLASLPKSYPIASLGFRAFRSQWGRCSNKREIVFNYKLSLLPLPLAHYIIAHELSHLAHMNHSPAFWKTVETLCPDHKACRKALRKYLP